MPSIVTHAYFGNDVYKKIKPLIRKKMDKKTYITFTKGPDVFYHSTINIIKGKNNREFADLLHTTKTKDFIIAYVDHILKYRLEKNPEVIGSLYGTITHYCLDQKTHPLIYYKCGLNKANHIKMERLIDLYMLEKREKERPNKINLEPMLFPKKTFSKPLINLLNRLYHDVYNKQNMGDNYLLALKEMKLHYKLFYYDKYKIKIKVYNVIAKLLPAEKRKIKYLSFANDLRLKVSYINFEHNVWNNPCDKNITSSDSFFDLYNNSIALTVKIINACNEVLNGDSELKTLNNIIPDTSLITGINCDNSKSMKYFDID